MISFILLLMPLRRKDTKFCLFLADLADHTDFSSSKNYQRNLLNLRETKNT